MTKQSERAFRKSETVELVLGWDDLSIDGQEKLALRLMDPVLEKYEDEIKEKASRYWDEASENFKKKVSYDRLFESEHCDKAWDVASRIHALVAIEVKL